MIPALALALPFAGVLLAGDPPISTLRDLGPALIACYKPPEQSTGTQVTVRFSLTSRGTIFGVPRITFSTAIAGEAERRAMIGAVLDALRRCTPLNVTPELGAAVAGRVMTIHLVGGPPARGV